MPASKSYKKPVKLTNSGLASTTTIVGLLFLVVSLGLGIYVVSNRIINFNPNEMAASCTSACMQSDFPELCGCTPYNIKNPPSSIPGGGGGLIVEEVIEEIEENNNGGGGPPQVQNTAPPSNKCDVNGTSYSNGAVVIGGTGSGSSGYAKCTNGKWVDCPTCTITQLSVVPEYLQEEYNQAVQQAQQILIEQEFIEQNAPKPVTQPPAPQSAQVSELRQICLMDGGMWNSQNNTCSYQTPQQLQLQVAQIQNSRPTGERRCNGAILETWSGNKWEQEYCSNGCARGSCITSAQTGIEVNRDDNGVTRDMYILYRNESNQTVAATNTPIEINVSTIDYSSYKDIVTTITNAQTGQTISQTNRSVASNIFGEYEVYNLAYCNRPGLTQEETRECNAKLSGAFNTPLINRYIQSYSPESVQIAWESKYNSLAECQQDMLQYGAQAAASCNTYKPTSEQIGSSTQLGTAITATGAVLVSGGGYLAGTLKGAEAIALGFAGLNTVQAGNAVDICITRPGSPECKNQVAWTMISYANVGTSYLQGLYQTNKAISTLNNVVNAANILTDFGDVYQSCTGEYASIFGCGAAISGTVFDVGQGAADFGVVNKLVNSIENSNVLQNLANTYLGGLDNTTLSPISLSQVDTSIQTPANNINGGVINQTAQVETPSSSMLFAPEYNPNPITLSDFGQLETGGGTNINNIANFFTTDSPGFNPLHPETSWSVTGEIPVTHNDVDFVSNPLVSPITNELMLDAAVRPPAPYPQVLNETVDQFRPLNNPTWERVGNWLADLTISFQNTTGINTSFGLVNLPRINEPDLPNGFDAANFQAGPRVFDVDDPDTGGMPQATEINIPRPIANAIENYIYSRTGGVLPFISDITTSLPINLRRLGEDIQIQVSNAVADIFPTTPRQNTVEVVVGNLSPNNIARGITGVEIGDNQMTPRLIDDHYALKQKYNLPDRGLRFENPREYIEQLNIIAKNNGISIRNADEWESFFQNHPAGAVFDEVGKQIFINPKVAIEDPLTYGGLLEHELIHALQNKLYPGMPVEIMEYEAYITANMSLTNVKSDPISVQETLFGNIDFSVNHWYQEKDLTNTWHEILTTVETSTQIRPIENTTTPTRTFEIPRVVANAIENYIYSRTGGVLPFINNIVVPNRAVDLNYSPPTPLTTRISTDIDTPTLSNAISDNQANNISRDTAEATIATIGNDLDEQGTTIFDEIKKREPYTVNSQNRYQIVGADGETLFVGKKLGSGRSSDVYEVNKIDRSTGDFKTIAVEVRPKTQEGLEDLADKIYLFDEIKDILIKQNKLNLTKYIPQTSAIKSEDGQFVSILRTYAEGEPILNGSISRTLTATEIADLREIMLILDKHKVKISDLWPTNFGGSGQLILFDIDPQRPDLYRSHVVSPTDSHYDYHWAENEGLILDFNDSEGNIKKVYITDLGTNTQNFDNLMRFFRFTNEAPKRTEWERVLQKLFPVTVSTVSNNPNILTRAWNGITNFSERNRETALDLLDVFNAPREIPAGNTSFTERVRDGDLGFTRNINQITRVTNISYPVVAVIGATYGGYQYWENYVSGETKQAVSGFWEDLTSPVLNWFNNLENVENSNTLGKGLSAIIPRVVIPDKESEDNVNIRLNRNQDTVIDTEAEQQPIIPKFTFYSQKDKQWQDLPTYGTTIEKSGCGIMTGAMVTGTDPKEYYEGFLNYFKDQKYDRTLTNSGTDFDDHKVYLEYLGYTVVPIRGSYNDVVDQINEYTSENVPVWMGAEFYNSGYGHFVLVTDVNTSNESLTLNDPWRGEDTNMKLSNIDTINEDGDGHFWEVYAIISPEN